MIAGAILALLVASGSAPAATTARDCLAARRPGHRVPGQAHPGETDNAAVARENAAVDRLAPMIREIVGPVRLPGYPASGRNNVDSLIGSDSRAGCLVTRGRQ